jgi:hypothetical protein
MEKMLLTCWTENEEIIKVYKEEGKRAEEGIHEALESLGGIFETEWHEIELEEAKGGYYCRFWNVVFLHGNLIIALFQIQLRENSCTMKMSRKVFKIGQRVFIRHRNGIKTTIIPARPPCPIRLRDHVQWGSPRRL